MLIFRPRIIAVSSFLALAACGGGGGGGGSLSAVDAFQSEWTDLTGDPTLGSFTSNTVVDARNGSANYSGVINISTDAATNPAGEASYFGNLDVTIDFTSGSTSDAVSGSAGGFVQYASENTSPKTGSGVSGSLTLAGALTGSNTTPGSGMSGAANGTIDGITVAYTFDGNVAGGSGTGVVLEFDPANANSGTGQGRALE